MTDQKMSADQKLIYCNDSWVLYSSTVPTITQKQQYLNLHSKCSMKHNTMLLQLHTYNTDASLGIGRLTGQTDDIILLSKFWKVEIKRIFKSSLSMTSDPLIADKEFVGSLRILHI